MITKPMLPPKAGYVEVIDENGNHVYKPTQETMEKLKAEDRVATLENDKAEKAEVQAVWDSMAAAYSEGVNRA